MKPVAVVGAGITGLTAAFQLRQRGIPAVVYEASDRAGGLIQTTRRGGFLVEQGPNTIMANKPVLASLFKNLDLENHILKPSEVATTRYIVRDGRPVAIPQSMGDAFTTGLLSLRAKARVLAEPFIPRTSYTDESLASFVRRRLGQEFLDYLIDPFVAGVYAGDPRQLSASHAFPKMTALEQRYGSLIRGAVMGRKERQARDAATQTLPKMFTLDGGLGMLPNTLANRLNGSLRLNCPVLGVARDTDGWQIHTPNGTETHAAVLLCSPAHQLPQMDTSGDLLHDLRGFEQVYYPPIARVAFGFQRCQVSHPLNGFGVLAPREEHRNILGVLFSSSMFPDRAPEGHVLLTVFAGGARNPSLARENDQEIARLALDDLQGLLGIEGLPVFTDVWKTGRSIPQYDVGYGAVESLIDRVEARSPGLFLAGSFRGGISVSDCIGGGATAAERVACYLA